MGTCCAPAPAVEPAAPPTFTDARDRDGWPQVIDGKCAITGLPTGKCECYEWDPEHPRARRRDCRDYFLHYVREAHRQLGLL